MGKHVLHYHETLPSCKTRKLTRAEIQAIPLLTSPFCSIFYGIQGSQSNRTLLADVEMRSCELENVFSIIMSSSLDKSAFERSNSQHKNVILLHIRCFIGGHPRRCTLFQLAIPNLALLEQALIRTVPASFKFPSSRSKTSLMLPT